MSRAISSRNTVPGRRRQRGLTMVELLVALVLSTLIALAAVSSLIVASRGFSTVDAASQLRDNGRFATELIQRIAQQGGFLDIPDAVNAITNGAGAAVPPPYVFGFDNAVMNLTAEPVPTHTIAGNRTHTTGGCTSPTDTACVNQADVLVMRFQTPATVAGGTLGDKSTINCAGITRTDASINRNDLAVSVFHVAVGSDGEPSLMCGHQSKSGVWQGSEPIIQGVETFQVLYGVDGVTPNNATLTTPDSIAERYLRADQIIVAGNPAATEANWRRVRSMRIGMVLRGPIGSSQDRGVNRKKDFYPLGVSDPGTKLTTPDDGRLRQVVSFTVYLRNYVGL